MGKGCACVLCSNSKDLEPGLDAAPPYAVSRLDALLPVPGQDGA